ncbi:unnamed protein product [Rhizoctonia solani]|uniref:t-SNARE coiled-coil homology domain-containing protein n=1 Tax=Rhizoctonia solani TaxID=456999 RepID=A0A8H3ASZ1_9AGAM|nr:unnamed protein product [Rhizoctonia solani]
MAQPDLGLIEQSLRTLATQVPLMSNHPAMNHMAQMQEMLRGMEGRLSDKITQSEQRTSARIDELNTRLAQTNTRIDQTNTRIDQINTRIDQTNTRIDQTNTRIDDTNAQIAQMTLSLRINDAKALARALNSSANQGTSRVYSLPLPNGDAVPPGQFPATYGAFRQLEGAPLAQLLQSYQLAAPPGALLDDRRRILATHCGIVW